MSQDSPPSSSESPPQGASGPSQKKEASSQSSWSPENVLECDLPEEGRLLFARPCTFMKGAPSLKFLPPLSLPEIAFAGRSNVGKSSLINALVNQKGLARASNTPGRTQHLNFFNLGEKAFLVDLPGYGYASAPKKTVDAWTRLVKDYLRGRVSLARVFLLIDSRHGLKQKDREIMKLLDSAAVSYQIVLTKIDKISPTALKKVHQQTFDLLPHYTAAYPEVLSTSAEKKEGLEMLRLRIWGLVRQMSSQA